MAKQKSSKKIHKCNNSTIVEAWANIQGLPGKYDDRVVKSIGLEAERTLIEFTRPQLVLLKKGQEQQLDDKVPPFWEEQYNWNQNNHIARFGHRYLSVHAICKPHTTQKYMGFENTFEAELDKWLEIYCLNSLLKDQNVDKVGFGYVNKFEFPLSNTFEISDHFNLNLWMDVGNYGAEMSKLEVSFELIINKNIHLTTRLKAAPVPNSNKIAITTNLYAEKRGLDKAIFSDTKQLKKTIIEVKDIAKQSFFKLVTDDTLEFMEAK